MKSPPHTGRVAVLSELFPGAKFIHISRDPYSIFPSTRRLWESLDQVQGFQLAKHRELDEYVFSCLERMYEGYWEQQEELEAGSICEVRYEDLVSAPLPTLTRIYDELQLGDFEPVREAVEAYLAEQKDYQVNRHELDEELAATIRERWAGYIETYGYAAPGSERPLSS